LKTSIMVVGLLITGMSTASAGDWHPTRVDPEGSNVPCIGEIEPTPDTATTDRQYTLSGIRPPLLGQPGTVDDSCSFDGKSAAGKKILSVCPNGTRCKVVADGEWGPPFRIYHVTSVASLPTIPADIRGAWIWTGSRREGVNVTGIKIGASGYHEPGYNCDLNRIQKSADTAEAGGAIFIIDMTCRDDGYNKGPANKVHEIWALRSIDGEDVLIVSTPTSIQAMQRDKDNKNQ
jgi:hypothetical protein